MYNQAARPQTTMSTNQSQYRSRVEEFSQPFYQSFIESQLLERAQQKELENQKERDK